MNSDQPEVKAAATLVNEILSTTSVSSAASTSEGPGGRHDNDFINFRDIAIVPASDEIQCTKKAFFRHATLLDDPNAKDTRTTDYLDNTFRLLREDMLYQLKEELQRMIELESVKEAVRNFFELVKTNYHRELEEKEPLQMSLNRVFLGSLGTGKTTFAKLYGQVLADLGLVSNGEGKLAVVSICRN